MEILFSECREKFILFKLIIALFKSSSVKSGQFLSINKNSEYTNCHGKKLLKRISPLVLINKSGSGIVPVYKYSENDGLRCYKAVRVWK